MATYHHFVTIEQEDGVMPMYIAAPTGSVGEHPTVFVLHAHSGLSASDFAVADRLAEEGFLAAAPELFYWGQRCFSAEEQSLRRLHLTDALLERVIGSANDFLQREPYGQPAKYGAVGFCMGGRVAFVLAARDPNCGAAASYYGGGINRREGGPSPIELADNITCPLQIFQGDTDMHPKLEEILEVDRLLTERGVAHELHRYPEATHGFMGRSNPASDDAWPKMLGMLRTALRTPVPAGR